jgi:hypothetical protein
VKWKGDDDASVNFSMYSRWKDYDERADTRTLGLGITGGRTFGDKENWQVSLSAYANKTTDDGTGYYDGYYDYRSVSGRLRVSHEIGPWTLSASANASNSEYDVRQATSGELFQRNGLSTEFEADRKINENWNLFAKWKKESDDSNDPLYEYEATMFSAGIKWSH